MADKTTIVWREWFNEAAVKQLTEMGTLPRNETEIASYLTDGDEVAAAVAKAAHNEDSQSFREGGEIVILEPSEFAGTYRIDVDYEPTFTAYRDEDG